MGFRSTNANPAFESLEISEETTNMGNAFNGVCDILEQRGLANRNGEAPVTVILSNFQDGPQGEKIIFAKVYIGASPEQVTQDLLTQQQS